MEWGWIEDWVGLGWVAFNWVELGWIVFSNRNNSRYARSSRRNIIFSGTGLCLTSGPCSRDSFPLPKFSRTQLLHRQNGNVYRVFECPEPLRRRFDNHISQVQHLNIHGVPFSRNPIGPPLRQSMRLPLKFCRHATNSQLRKLFGERTYRTKCVIYLKSTYLHRLHVE